MSKPGPVLQHSATRTVVMTLGGLLAGGAAVLLYMNSMVTKAIEEAANEWIEETATAQQMQQIEDWHNSANLLYSNLENNASASDQLIAGMRNGNIEVSSLSVLDRLNLDWGAAVHVGSTRSEPMLQTKFIEVGHTKEVGNHVRFFVPGNHHDKGHVLLLRQDGAIVGDRVSANGIILESERARTEAIPGKVVVEHKGTPNSSAALRFGESGRAQVTFGSMGGGSFIFANDSGELSLREPQRNGVLQTR